MSALTLLSEHGCFGGVQRFYKHDSREIRGPMKFSAYLPPQARAGKVPWSSPRGTLDQPMSPASR